jgi:glutamate racemase
MSALVGLFDSGLGGLTVLRRLQERYPHSSCLYLGDTARVPYGQRSVADIRAIAAEVVVWLRHQQVGVLVMACNTSNALALEPVAPIDGRSTPAIPTPRCWKSAVLPLCP